MDLCKLFKKETKEELLLKAKTLSKEIEYLFLEYKSNLIIYNKEIIYYSKMILSTNDVDVKNTAKKKIDSVLCEDIPKCLLWESDKKINEIENKLARMGVSIVKGETWIYNKKNSIWNNKDQNFNNLKQVLIYSYGDVTKK